MKVGSMLIYPAFVSVLVLALLIVFPTFVLGGMIDFVWETGVEIPLASRVVFWVCDLVRSGLFWLGLVVLAVVTGVGAGLAFRVENQTRRTFEEYVVKGVGNQPAAEPETLLGPLSRLRMQLARPLNRVPIFGGVLRTRSVCIFARALAFQLEVGIPWVKALPSALEASAAPSINEVRIRAVRRDLEAGVQPEDALEALDVFPKSFLSYLRAGSEVGKTSEVAGYLGDLYESELEYRLEQALSVLEPAVILAIGLTVGLLVVAVMLPMTELVTTL